MPLIKFTLWNLEKAQEANVCIQTRGRQKTCCGESVPGRPIGFCSVTDTEQNQQNKKAHGVKSKGQ